MSSKHSEITPEIINLADKSYEKSIIDNELFVQYDVKRGLRDLNGRGVLTGLTHISDVRANKIVDGEQIPLPGELFYRGYNVKDLVKGFTEENRFGFEEITYLLLFGELPSQQQLDGFVRVTSYKIGFYRGGTGDSQPAPQPTPQPTSNVHPSRTE